MKTASLYEMKYHRHFFISAVTHGIVIFGIIWIFQSLSHNKPLRLPLPITLVSFPVVDKNNTVPEKAPPPVRAGSVAHVNKSSPASQPTVQQNTLPPLTNDINPVPTSQNIKEQPDEQVGQTGNAQKSTGGTTGEEVAATRIGSAQALDNVDFSPLYNPKPAYPVFAYKAAIQGSVDVDLVINEFGRVEEFTIVNVVGHPSFGEETAKIIGKWRFPPPRIDGKKTKIKFLYTVTFKLD